ncbi:hypothetical protein EGH10_04650 [Brevibacillus laterosporus]|uniref:Lipoprotein n=1 Tax=Brevibacillus laterosporus LMG 15441 TaxID=1042163 RepID=A0A075R969_BRELA|nr:hypothetical protein [Brevibacillus laterosporus]AIG28419.1 hypothetical protein BRLA_c041440 [Brevibacillus laterosporus LMG 15441]RJL13493.1 hypothetical protein DM460_05745 [Brevibacillus laterosporus]TPH16878.1 hypothetical protein EGH10_04650 [Brevibacillus laterosporus]HAS01508.1 hypothetical protein [Brevibacillus sp.]
MKNILNKIFTKLICGLLIITLLGACGQVQDNPKVSDNKIQESKSKPGSTNNSLNTLAEDSNNNQQNNNSNPFEILNNSIATLEKSLADLSVKVDNNAKVIAQNTANIADNKTEVDTLKQENATLKQANVSIENRLTAIENSIHVEMGIAKLNNQLIAENRCERVEKVSMLRWQGMPRIEVLFDKNNCIIQKGFSDEFYNIVLAEFNNGNEYEGHTISKVIASTTTVSDPQDIKEGYEYHTLWVTIYP